MKFIIISLCLVELLASVYSATVPSYIKVCMRHDPNLNQCVKNSVLGLRDKFKTGLPELEISPLEPLRIDDDLTLADSESFSAKTKNVNIHGTPNFDDLDVKVDVDRHIIEINLHYDIMKVEGDYDIKAKILVPITAKGPIQIETTPYVKICKRRDPNLNQCIKESILKLRGMLKAGLPDFKIVPLEPLVVDESLSLASSQSFSASTNNINIYKIPEFDDVKVNMDIDKKFLELNVHFADLRLEADYDIAARILVPITAKGPIEIDIRDVTAKLLLKFDTVIHKGEEYIYFTSSTCKLTIPDYTSHFVPSPGQDQTFAEAINDVLNSSKKDILASITTGLERGVAKKIINIANGVGKSFTYEQLIPNAQ